MCVDVHTVHCTAGDTGECLRHMAACKAKFSFISGQPVYVQLQMVEQGLMHAGFQTFMQPHVV